MDMHVEGHLVVAQGTNCAHVIENGNHIRTETDYGTIAVIEHSGGYEFQANSLDNLKALAGVGAELVAEADNKEMLLLAEDAYRAEADQIKALQLWQMSFLIEEYHIAMTELNDVPEGVEVQLYRSHVIFHVPNGYLSVDGATLGFRLSDGAGSLSFDGETFKLGSRPEDASALIEGFEAAYKLLGANVAAAKSRNNAYIAYDKQRAALDFEGIDYARVEDEIIFHHNGYRFVMSGTDSYAEKDGRMHDIVTSQNIEALLNA